MATMIPNLDPSVINNSGEQGELYIFADPGQTLFDADSDAFAGRTKIGEGPVLAVLFHCVPKFPCAASR